ncbi:spermidine/putrescine ABC transporter permease [Rhizobium rhizosphaerae]|uniref:Spermidine/putrescine ABC transporter permease n=1 Tax=Xaviernesmea rhizosphaerae TaxID=1672749 RepID=A0ABX3PI53_9HYPH|nr:ABC transporter permease [Xaviernesmea rhizosphaerae]OQP87805.1 spermidine/putrescine ABC transporter permease [Xaviernesmea rhizosphaerae]
MKISRIVALIIVLIAASFFLVPLYATFQFSLQMLRGQWSLQAYRSVFSDPQFLSTLSYSAVASLAAIVISTLIIVPTTYWVRLKMPRVKPFMEFITLLPLIIPPIVIVFGYLRLYGSDSMLPLTVSTAGTNVMLVIGYATLSLPYVFRSVDNGMQTLDIRTLTEAAEILGASRATIIFRVILPNLRAAIVSGAFLTFSISFGEFVFASLLNRPAFGPYLVQIGQDRAYEPAALAVLSFALTWACMVLMQIFANAKPGASARRRPAALFPFARRKTA